MTESFFSAREQCPACASANFAEFYRRAYLSAELKNYLTDFYGSQGTVEFEYLRDAEYVLCECRVCRMIFQKDIPNEGLMLRIYEHWINPEKGLERMRSAPLAYFQDLADELAQIASLFRRPPAQLRFLDFGMGWGAWASLAKAHGIDSYGMDLSGERTRHAQSQGVKVVEWDDIPNCGFDFINTEQVFEHIAAPLETLRHLRSGLKPGGIIKISVPYAADIARRLALMNWKAPKGTADSLNPVAPLEHINYFRRESLLKMGGMVGMREVAVPLSQHYAGTRFFKGGVLGLFKKLIQPVYRRYCGNYVLLGA